MTKASGDRGASDTAVPAARRDEPAAHQRARSTEEPIARPAQRPTAPRPRQEIPEAGPTVMLNGQPYTAEQLGYAPWQPLPGERPPSHRRVPSGGWRGAVYGLSGKTINLGVSSTERMVERWRRTIDTPVRTHTIATMNVKGGSGKTTTTVALGTIYALHRRDTCIAIDANPDRGNLAQRIGQEHLLTVRDLLENLQDITGAAALRRFTNQATSRFEVIASDRDPVKARAFTPDEYRVVMQMLRAFRQVILTDTGIDLTNRVVDAVLAETETLVIAASTAQDVATLAWETLNSVEQRGFEHLVKGAVVSIVKESHGDQVPIDELRQAFEDRCRTVVVIPHEKSLVGGGLFDWYGLSPRAKRAYLELAAKVAEDFVRSSPWR